MTRRGAIIGALLGAVGARYSANAEPAGSQEPVPDPEILARASFVFQPAKMTININFGGPQGVEALIVVFSDGRFVRLSEADVRRELLG